MCYKLYLFWFDWVTIVLAFILVQFTSTSSTCSSSPPPPHVTAWGGGGSEEMRIAFLCIQSYFKLFTVAFIFSLWRTFVEISQVCEILEDNAINAKIGNSECEPWVVTSWLRDHLLSTRERRNALLWKKVLLLQHISVNYAAADFYTHWLALSEFNDRKLDRVTILCTIYYCCYQRQDIYMWAYGAVVRTLTLHIRQSNPFYFSLLNLHDTLRIWRSN